MPELPEVETIRRGLEDHIVGLTLTDIEVRAPKIFIGEPEEIIGEDITSVERQGKLLIFRLSGSKLMTIHLKMTGQLIWKPAMLVDRDPAFEELDPLIDNAVMPYSEEEVEEDDEVVMGGHPEKSYLQPLPHKHTHAIFQFSDGSRMYFNDLRKFGRITVLEAEDLPKTSFLERLGPEPLQSGFTAQYLVEQLAQRPRQPIKTFLLDQSNIAGLGNIYADESLFRAAILPDRLTGSLTAG